MKCYLDKNGNYFQTDRETDNPDDTEVLQRPSHLHIFVGGAWELDFPRTRAEKWDDIKAERDRRKSGGFKVVVGGEEKWFHSDDPSRSQYGVLLTTAVEKALPIDFVFDAGWKTMDGTKLPMTVGLVRSIRDAGLVTEKNNFNNAETHKAAMEASADPAAYDFSADWASAYGE